MTDIRQDEHREYIKNWAKSIKEKVVGGTLFGITIEEGDIDMLIVAAYEAGKFERTKNDK